MSKPQRKKSEDGWDTVMTVLKARVHSQIHALLTPEQRERMQEMRARHRRSRHGS